MGPANHADRSPTNRASKRNARRPGLPPISEAMKAWTAALAIELQTWPHVTTRSMFGFTAYYRKDVIFALLPKTRAMESPNALAFKLASPDTRLRLRMRQDQRIRATELQKARWLSFEVSSESDLHGGLEWLSHAYEAAK